MRVRRLTAKNFRGIAEGTVDFAEHTLLVGGNNAGKSTVCEALDLVLGPERLYRRPIIDEHDFHRGQYLDADGTPVEIVIHIVLIDLSEEAQRRFYRHLRLWDEATGDFADEGDGGPEAADAKDTVWALPIAFIGRYDQNEDDFIGNTFFDHPVEPPREDEEEAGEIKLGGGRTPFGREQKRLCGFVFLRTLRTGSRALSLQRGSLLDTVLRLGGSGLTEMWEDTLTRLRQLEPAIGEIKQLKTIREEIRTRMARFVPLSTEDDATAFFASELTRNHLREVVRLFVAAEPAPYLVPFQRLGTGSINLLVFALLTFIADLKGKQSVIFAMEEPEIALPPHTQRRVSRFVLNEMGQAIMTSHSPYVIEQFDAEQIVVLERQGSGRLTSRMVKLNGIEAKKYRQERRQLAEAVLSRAVLVVEGATEAAMFPVASEVMERSPGSSYVHFDLEGVSVFNAGTDNAVPKFGPFFRALGKMSFALYDKQKTPLTGDAATQLATYTKSWELSEKGIEKLLVKEISVEVLKRFLETCKGRADYPSKTGTLRAEMPEEQVRALTLRVLKARKGAGHNYSALLIGECGNADQLPATIRTILETINKELKTKPPPQEQTDTGVEKGEEGVVGENPAAPDTDV